MIVSWNELQRACQKAFRGLGVAAGADDDGAFAVLWLQARGLDALAPLAAALSAFEGTPPRPLVRSGREGYADILDAGGQPAVSVASDALDFAVSCAGGRGMRAEVRVLAVEGGIFVAGALAHRPPSGHRVRIRWREGNTRRELDVGSAGERLLLTAPAGGEGNAGLASDTVRILVGEPRGRRHASWRIDADEAELERRALHSVSHGIEVPDALWRRLLAFAGRTLVPASAASREQGAGGGAYDD